LGSSIHWLIVTAIYAQSENEAWTLNSSGQRHLLDVDNIAMQDFSPELVERRCHELRQVGQAYSFDSVHELCLPAMCLDQLPMSLLINRFSEIMHTVRPDTVILPFKSDVHSDHRICFEAAYPCTKSFR
jgi:N-acetylglucosamine malate deacetylase 1